MKQKSNFVILLILTVCCAVLIVATTLNSEYIKPIKNGVGYILTPVQSTVSKLGASIYDALAENRTYREVLQ